MDIRYIKMIDSVIGKLVVSLLPLPLRPRLLKSYSSFLIIRPGGIGDAVHLFPMIQLLKTHYPYATVDILAEKRNSTVFALSPDVSKVLRYDVPFEFLSLISRPYDVVIDTEQWHHLSAIVARFMRSAITIGFGSNERRRMLTFPMPYSHDEYELESFIRLLIPLGVIQSADIHNRMPWIHVSESVSKMAEVFLRSLSGRDFVAIFPGASIPERRWNVERFRSVALQLQESGLDIVVVGGGGDLFAGGRICEAGAAINTAGKTNLLESAAIIRRAALLISGDSGILHLGVALGTPTVSLFGSGRAAKWAPRGDMHIVLNKNVECSPCTTFGTTPRCPYNCRCMDEITVEDVTGAAMRLLSARGRIRM